MIRMLSTVPPSPPQPTSIGRNINFENLYTGIDPDLVLVSDLDLKIDPHLDLDLDLDLHLDLEPDFEPDPEHVLKADLCEACPLEEPPVLPDGEQVVGLYVRIIIMIIINITIIIMIISIT